MEFNALIFSEILVAFLQKAKQVAKIILTEEMGLKTGRTRFYYGSTAYPLHFVAFEHQSQLGYFHSEFYEIGLNKCLLFEGKKKLSDTLRHELAHYLTFIEKGAKVPAHGVEFHEVCKRFGWGKDVSQATLTTELSQENKQEKIFQKVQKLLSLANSHHTEEAQAAMLKANELLIKYNLEALPRFAKSDQSMHLLRLFQVKRSSPKLQAIASILRHFLVYPVFNHGRVKVYLEIFGEKINVQIAEYIGHFLDKELEKLWEKAPHLKGMRSKNSFFRGIAEGYKEKVQMQWISELFA